MRCDLLRQMAARISQVCVESAPSLLDIDWEPHAYAVERRRDCSCSTASAAIGRYLLQTPALSSKPAGRRRRCGSMGQTWTDGRSDARPLSLYRARRYTVRAASKTTRSRRHLDRLGCFIYRASTDRHSDLNRTCSCTTDAQQWRGLTIHAAYCYWGCGRTTLCPPPKTSIFLFFGITLSSKINQS